jgi:hypothetical protein
MSDKASKTASIQAPNMDSLATLYRNAMRGNNAGLASVAEAAVMKLAAAEAAATEATVLAKFMESNP